MSPRTKPTERRRWDARPLTQGAPSKCHAGPPMHPATNRGRLCLLMPIKPVAARNTRSLARRIKFARWSKNLRQAGAHYVLLTFAGGLAQLHRFAREIMPAFSRPAGVPRAAE